jgi:hypothetical protein
MFTPAAVFIDKSDEVHDSLVEVTFEIGDFIFPTLLWDTGCHRNSVAKTPPEVTCAQPN